MATKDPQPADKYVSTRMRIQRRALGLSQQRLADRIGVAVAQVQKYENGTNRVSANGLQQIALALKVASASFLDKAPTLKSAPKLSARFREFAASPVGVALSRAFTKITDKTVRRLIVALVGRIARL